MPPTYHIVVTGYVRVMLVPQPAQQGIIHRKLTRFLLNKTAVWSRTQMSASEGYELHGMWREIRTDNVNGRQCIIDAFILKGQLMEISTYKINTMLPFAQACILGPSSIPLSHTPHRIFCQ